MTTIDARRQPPEEQTRRRTQVSELYAAGIAVMQIVERTGLSYMTVRRTIDVYVKLGPEGLEPKPRGRKPGSGAAITVSQQTEVCKLMRLRPPRYYGLGDSMWSRATVGKLISKKLGVALTDRTVQNYLRQWGLEMPGEPKGRASVEVQAWLALNLDGLRQRATEQSTPIYWLNAPQLLKAPVWGEGAAKSGTSAARKFRMASVTDSQGKLMWRVIEGNLTGDSREKLFKALLADSGAKQAILIAHREGLPKSPVSGVAQVPA